jgi:putative membrane protein
MLFFIPTERMVANALDARKTWLCFVCIYHAKCQQIYNQLQRNEVKYTTNFMRLWNEGADSFAVVFLVILKNAVN